MNKDRWRKFTGFAVTTAKLETRQAYEKRNLQIEGHPDDYKIFKETVFLDPEY